MNLLQLSARHVTQVGAGCSELLLRRDRIWKPELRLACWLLLGGGYWSALQGQLRPTANHQRESSTAEGAIRLLPLKSRIRGGTCVNSACRNFVVEDGPADSSLKCSQLRISGHGVGPVSCAMLPFGELRSVSSPMRFVGWRTLRHAADEFYYLHVFEGFDDSHASRLPASRSSGASSCGPRSIPSRG